MTRTCYSEREHDWRNGATVYHIVVDRFVPSAHLSDKAGLYPAPKRLRDWSELPTQGSYLPDHQVWSHELDFWGGDIASLRSRLDHLSSLGATVCYLCPIHLAWTNHGYDALDYAEVRPEYGTRDDVIGLADDLHSRGMKLVLDGVFNHMGRHAPAFTQALASESPTKRSWFTIDETLPAGAVSWANAANLPETRIEDPGFARYVYRSPHSVVRRWLRDGADGWRLDVAFELGPEALSRITEAAHAEKPGSLVLGEIANYPSGWLGPLDGVLSMTLRDILLLTAQGKLKARQATAMLRRYFADADFENLLKSWVYLENHDTPRLATVVASPAQRRLATVLQHTVPGSVDLYYGQELEMTGGEDPENRAPMRWDLVSDDTPSLAWYRTLAHLRRLRALRVGDIRFLDGHRLVGFERYTDRAGEAVIVFANPTGNQVSETVLIPDPWLMDARDLVDELSGQRVPFRHGIARVELEAHGALVLRPDTAAQHGYTPYKRVP